MAVTMVLTLNDNGTLGINGPLDNKVLFYGILELAREGCREYHEKKGNSPLAGLTLPPASAWGPPANGKAG